MPEPIEHFTPVDTSDARRKLGIPAGGWYLALVGPIDTRKGADLLLRAFGEAQIGDTSRLLLAGTVSAEIRRALDERFQHLLEEDRIVVIDRFLSTEEFWLALCASDVVAVPYPDHIGSSGILARAAYLGRPVVASEFGWVGEATRRFSLGRAVDVRDPAALVAALESARQDSHVPRRNTTASEYVAFNTPANFQRRWLARIRERRVDDPPG